MHRALAAFWADAEVPLEPAAAGPELDLATAADPAAAVAAAARLWTHGVPIRWDRLRTAPHPRRVGLATYPFEGRRHRLHPAVGYGP